VRGKHEHVEPGSFEQLAAQPELFHLTFAKANHPSSVRPWPVVTTRSGVAVGEFLEFVLEK